MSQHNETGHRTGTAGEAITRGARVYYNSTLNTIVLATAAIAADGTAMNDAASGQTVTVRLNSASGTHVVVASGALATVGAVVYGAAAGKVSATFSPTDAWKILHTASGDGAQVEAEYLGREISQYGSQGDPTAETAAATITAADIASGIVTITHAAGATVALTLDTGTAMDTALPNVPIGGFLDWTVINPSAAAADTATVTAAAGHTVVGTMICQSAHATTGLIHGNALRLRSRRTAANTWITYRLA
jgi:hypothetical protein